MEEVELFQAWYGLVGFGIPTIGLNNPSLLAAVKGQPNQALMKQLCLDDKGTPSPYLQKLKLRFEDCLRQRIKSSTAAEIIYFWETHKSVPRLVGRIHFISVFKKREPTDPVLNSAPMSRMTLFSW